MLELDAASVHLLSADPERSLAVPHAVALLFTSEILSMVHQTLSCWFPWLPYRKIHRWLPCGQAQTTLACCASLAPSCILCPQNCRACCCKRLTSCMPQGCQLDQATAQHSLLLGCLVKIYNVILWYTRRARAA